MSRLIISNVVVAGLLATMTAAPARASITDTYDKLAYLTFSGSVQIPGATLQAGTYRFHLADPSSGRKVMQVLSHDGKIVYSMFFTLPDIRWTVTDNPTVTFKETPAGLPPAVKSLFYGGETYGYAFVYGKELTVPPPVAPQPPIAYTPIPAVAAPEPVPEPVAEPVPEPPAPEPVPEPIVNNELPKTASQLPLYALGGLFSLVIGLGVSLLAKR